MSKPVSVKDVYEYFHYRRLCGDDESLNRPIKENNINRPGLELTGYFDDPVNRIILIGEKETHYIDSQMSEEQQRRVFDFLTRDTIPMILIAHDMPCPPLLLEVAQQKNFPLFSSFAPTSALGGEIVSFLEEYFAEVAEVHGELLQVYGRGVLIEGDSGIGKSEIALELIKNGHVLIADDCVDLYRAHNQVYGEAPELLKGMLEIRGVGVQDVTRLYGIRASGDRATVECVISLVRWNQDDDFDRLGLDAREYEDYFGIKVPKITIPVREGRSIAVLIETAVTDLIMTQKHINENELFDERLRAFIASQKEDR